MHLSLILLALALAGGTRWLWATWANSAFSLLPGAIAGNGALFAFLFPPLLLLTTAVAVLYMGTQGQMLGLPVGWIGYGLALGFLGWSGLTLLKSAEQAWRSLRQLQDHPQRSLHGLTGKVLTHATPFAAQVGFWRSELVISQGLLDTLNLEQLKAVLAHEQAHAHHHDTFWFFWLGWLRQVTVGLPQTEALWQELLLLRELRADRWAAQQVDALLLAESLLLVVQAPLIAAQVEAQGFCAAFGADLSLSRLEERIDALLTDAADVTALDEQGRSVWVELLLSLTPFLTVLFHT